MISFLDGTMAFSGERFVVLEVGGIGYKVFVGPGTLAQVLERGKRYRLWTHEHLREDARELYGFLHLAELELFETLLVVPGIGPRGALGVLGIAPIDTLKKAIAAGDTSYLTRVSGIGRKTAEKIVLELRERLAGKGVVVEAPELQAEADALEAMVALGYSQSEARSALARVPEGVQGAEKRIGEALKQLGKKT